MSLHCCCYGLLCEDRGQVLPTFTIHPQACLLPLPALFTPPPPIPLPPSCHLCRPCFLSSICPSFLPLSPSLSPLTLPASVKRSFSALSVYPCTPFPPPYLSPPGSRWCDVLGFVPVGNVSGSSTLRSSKMQAIC